MATVKRVIVIPAYCEETVIGNVVRDAVRVADSVVVVDDGSTDRTGEVAQAAGAIVVRHALNRGLGGALGTGISAARLLGATAICTMDADGQHRAADAGRVFERLARGDVDFVIGSRMLPGARLSGAEGPGLSKVEGARLSEVEGPDRAGMPTHRVVLNRLGNLLTLLLFGVRVTDSQSGLRGLTRAAADGLELRTNGMEVSSEFVNEIRRRRWRFTEISIPAIYTDYSLSKGQSVGGGFRTAAKLISRRFLG
jgi:glycosyltransferase involved in cell wall biosynthesis